MSNGAALAVGALGAAVRMLGSRALKAVKVSDPAEVGAAHGLVGAMGAICVGLFHRHDGLFTSGSGELLRSQVLGTLAIAGLSLCSVLLFGAMRFAGALGLMPQRRKEELGPEALQELFSILDRSGIGIEDTLEALAKLKAVVWRPFSPQAGNHKVEGEVLDICGLLSYNVSPGDEYLAFISHYKAEGGDAARIVYDRITATVLAHLGVTSEELPRARRGMARHSSNPEESEKLKKFRQQNLAAYAASSGSDEKPRRFRRSLASSASPADSERRKVRRSHTEASTGTPEQAADAVQLPGSICPPELRRDSAPGEIPTHAQQSGGSAKKMDSDSSFFGDCQNPQDVALHNLLTGTGFPEGPQFSAERLLFLDSCELRDLEELLGAVRRSSNFVILLTRGVLTRPWVLAELTIAAAQQKNIVAVPIEWPDKDNERHFSFPDGLDDLSRQLELYAPEQGRRLRWQRLFTHSGSSMGVVPSWLRHTSTDSLTKPGSPQAAAADWPEKLQFHGAMPEPGGGLEKRASEIA